MYIPEIINNYIDFYKHFPVLTDEDVESLVDYGNQDDLEPEQYIGVKKLSVSKATEDFIYQSKHSPPSHRDVFELMHVA